MKAISILLLFILMFSFHVHAASPLAGDSTKKRINSSDSLAQQHLAPQPIPYLHLIAPVVFITYGIVSLNNPALKELNTSTQYEIYEHQPDHVQWDNYTQYAPALMVYGLNAFGVKGEHNLRDRSIIYASSQLISAALVTPLKHLIREERPDGSNSLSFPSGHTATAFSSAQFMFREYKDHNFWLSISGYSFALFTGVYRTLNDRHWVNDVVAGAGFGILSTELAYWTYPKLNRLLFTKHPHSSNLLLPYYHDKAVGLSLVSQF
ncbi:phosphatase PAP2 family protein [Sphingobacterium humi]|nr:phosphatase PAP2 family protein [Sphingobacterium humi]